jgi:DNA-binding GntR family transcriptional regulator
MFLARQDVIIENIADEVAERIIMGRLEGGARLPEIPLANSLGVSRGSMREALLFLSHFHLTETFPNCGAKVIPFQPDDMISFFDFWEVVLSKAVSDLAPNWRGSELDRLERARKKINKADQDKTERARLILLRDFFIELYSASQNQFTRKSLETLLAPSLRAFYIALSNKDQEAQALVLVMVNSIVDAVLARDSQGAKDAVHIAVARLVPLCRTKMRPDEEED